MLRARGPELRIETSPLTLSPDDLSFVRSLAPLLGDTPRRVKRFVNICQLILAMPPRLTPGSEPGRRQIVCLLAAVAEGLPGVATQLFPAIRTTPTVVLSQWCATRDGIGEQDGIGERDRLTAWLAERPTWAALPLQRLDVRLDMVDRLAFAPPRL